MMGYPAADIALMSGAHLEGALNSKGMVEHLLTDSRKLTFPDSTLFFAIQTKQGNGHDYIPDLYRQGVRHFMVSELPDPESFPGAVFYVVGDVVKALQQLAAHHRKQFSIPVIGITGSNGKTIVKEWLNALLQYKLKMVRSPRSYNSQLGVHSVSGECRNIMSWPFLKLGYQGLVKWHCWKKWLGLPSG